MSNTRRVLYVDPDREALLLLQTLLAADNLDVTVSEIEARVLARRHSYDIYILGGGGPGSVALDLCAWMHRIDPCTPIVFYSSNNSAKFQQLALEAGAVRYEVKPLDPATLRSTLNLILKLGEIESQRAMAAAQQAIVDELRARAARASDVVMPSKSQGALDRMLRGKAYRAFRDAGGNRANFERLWPEAIDHAMAAAAPLANARSDGALNPRSGPRGKQ